MIKQVKLLLVLVKNIVAIRDNKPFSPFSFFTKIYNESKAEYSKKHTSTEETKTEAK